MQGTREPFRGSSGTGNKPFQKQIQNLQKRFQNVFLFITLLFDDVCVIVIWSSLLCY